MYKVTNTVHSSESISESFESMVLRESERVKPIIKEQFLKDYILGIGDADEIFDIYCRTFGMDREMPVRMVVLKYPDGCSYEDMFFIRNTAQKSFEDKSLLLLTGIANTVVIVTDILDDKLLSEHISRTINLVKRCYKLEITVIYSSRGEFFTIPEMYERLRDGLAYSFYNDSAEVLYEGDFCTVGKLGQIEPEYGAIEYAIRNGDKEKTKELIEKFFETLKLAAPVPAMAKTYCMELYVCMIRCCSTETMDKYMKGIITVQEFSTLLQIKTFINEKAQEIAASNCPPNVKVFSSLIKETIDLIEKNLNNENLSLRWLAGTILYTNVDYLGKLFKKETGKNFSHYVMEKRMEMAKNLIVGGNRDRIYEVAQKVGYGSNSQYFSQVFKKYTGVSPLEYKEFARYSAKAVNI